MEIVYMTNQQPEGKTRQRVFWAVILLTASALLVAIGWIRLQRGGGSIPPVITQHMTYEVVNTYPHDLAAFTQGLVYHEGYLYESTGLYGQSSLRKVALDTGVVLQQVDLPPNYFGEGLALWEDTLLQITWLEETGFIYALEDFSLLGQFTYPTEGWGLTHDGERLIMCDGSHRLYFLDPSTFEITGQVEVTDQGRPVERLNELEYIQGEVYANIWLTDDIVRIDPGTGVVLGWIDLAGILPEALRTPDTDVLNGIAYDPVGDRLFVTGKNWPELYEIRLVPVIDGN
jgi:glutaminyl-peptide cyclotransferase